jgi:hypothetical protein
LVNGNEGYYFNCRKGHETYQEIQGIRYDFDDMKMKRIFTTNEQIVKPKYSNKLNSKLVSFKKVLGFGI